MNRTTKLIPAQRRAARCILRGLRTGDVLVLEGQPGTGKTTVLREVHRHAGGRLLGVRQFLDALAARGPTAIEEAFLGMLDEAVAAYDLIFVDDLHLVTNIVEGCDYQRSHLLDAALTAVLGEASAQGKKIVFATAEEAPWPIRRRAFAWEIREFTAEDYRSLCEVWLDAQVASQLDYDRIHRFVPMLNAYELKSACASLGRRPEPEADPLLRGSTNAWAFRSLEDYFLEAIDAVRASHMNGQRKPFRLTRSVAFGMEAEVFAGD